MPFATVQGARLNYLQIEPEQARASEDLIMVHGLGTSLAFWYLPYAPVFAQRYRVTLFDLRGHGRSQMTASGYTPLALARDLEGLLDCLGIVRAHFIAHSFGGVVTLGLARLDQRRVRSLVLADTHLSLARGLHAEEWARREALQTLVDQHRLGLDTRDPYFGHKLLTAAARLQVQTGSPTGLLELLGPTFRKCGSRTAKQWLDLVTLTAAEEELMADDALSSETLRPFQFPTLALYGDKSLARPTGDALHTLWPHATFQLLPEAGHYFPTTRPDEVITACDQFWAKLPLSSDREVRSQRPRALEVFHKEGAWFFLAQDRTRIGPFTQRDEAHAELAVHVAGAGSAGVEQLGG